MTSTSKAVQYRLYVRIYNASITLNLIQVYVCDAIQRCFATVAYSAAVHFNSMMLKNLDTFFPHWVDLILYLTNYSWQKQANEMW